MERKETRDMNTKSKRYLSALAFLTALLLISFVNIISAIQNDGMEGDEVFSYISATSTGGFKGICYLNDQTWYDADYFRNAVTATDTERFNIGMVVENQVMDTHPPLFYLFLNLICSVFEGQYSRWFGIFLNIFFMLWVEIGLYLLILYFIHDKRIALITSTIFCCSRLAVSMTLFIRMYVLLMALTLFISLYHLKLYDEMTAVHEYSVKKHWKTCLILSLLTISGALTHYYFLVYQFLISAFFIIALLYQKRYRNIGRYLAVMAGSAVIYLIMYPAAVYHILFKYRGRDAVHKFLKESSIFKEVSSVLSSFNSYLFKGTLWILAALLLIFTIILLIKGNIGHNQFIKLGFSIIPSLIYFYGISKASPYAIIRYISPVAALLYAAVVIWAKSLLDVIKRAKIRNAAYIALCACSFFTSFYFFTPSIKASYFTERQNIVNNIAKDTDYCVYIGGEGSYWKMWEDYVNYPAFQGLYFIDGEQKNPITDKKLLEQDRLMIYLETTLEPEEIFSYLQLYLPLQQYEIQYTTAYTYIISAQ